MTEFRRRNDADLILLSETNEDIVFSTLEKRLRDGLIYT